jgi:riboflavin kinase/FMN adenylyltransferase
MQVHRALDQLPDFARAVITIGTFDGVHKGHQEIIASMKEAAAEIDGETVILTFHPHPRQIVRASGEPMPLLTTLDEKIALLDAQGVDHLVVIPFTLEFSQLSAEAYIQHFLFRYFHPHTIIIGYDHRFGNNRSGDFRLLEAQGPLYGFRVREIPERVLDLLKVSSTRIREALHSGQPSLAADLLGYRYFFEGLVVQGQQLGRTLGFPTANLAVQDPEKLIPVNGVYAVRVDMAGGGSAGGMMNIGVRPTVGGLGRVIEVHLLDYKGDLYGQTLRVHLEAYLRPEQKFNGLDALKTQLERDRVNTINILEP